jgi:hypothetical protein
MSAPPSVHVLRESVRRAVAASSLRAVADQIGLSHRGVRLFVLGSVPRKSTLRKLREWYVRRGAEMHQVSEETVAAALEVLLGGVPEKIRREAERAVLEVVRQAHSEAGLRQPDWIT